MNDLLDIRVDLTPDSVTIRLAGELDISNVQLVDRAISTAPPDVTAIRFDLSELDYIDSSGLTIIAACARRMAPARLTLVGPRASTLRLLELTGMSALLDIVESPT